MKVPLKVMAVGAALLSFSEHAAAQPFSQVIVFRRQQCRFGLLQGAP
jgi:hypothetical protein